MQSRRPSDSAAARIALQSDLRRSEPAESRMGPSFAQRTQSSRAIFAVVTRSVRRITKRQKGKPAPDAAASSSAAAAAAAAPKSAASLSKKKIITDAGFTAAFTDAPAATVSVDPASSSAASASSPPPRPMTVCVIPLPRSRLCAIPVSFRQPFVDALFSLCASLIPTQFSCGELHPSLPDSQCASAADGISVAAENHPRAQPNDATGHTDEADADAAEAKLRTYHRLAADARREGPRGCGAARGAESTRSRVRSGCGSEFDWSNPPPLHLGSESSCTRSSDRLLCCLCSCLGPFSHSTAAPPRRILVALALSSRVHSSVAGL